MTDHRPRTEILVDGCACLQCRRCSKNRPVAEFALRLGRYRHSWCNRCVLDARNEARRAQRAVARAAQAFALGGFRG